MSKSRKPAIFVAVILGILIFLPLLIIAFQRIGGYTDRRVATDSANFLADDRQIRSSVVENDKVSTSNLDFETQKLAEQANALVEGELATGLRKGDVTLDYMSEIKEALADANEDLRKKRTRRASERFAGIINSIQNELGSVELAEKARSLSGSIFDELKRLERLEATFQNSYKEAVQNYNSGQQAQSRGDNQSAVDAFTLTGAILDDLEARASKRVTNLVEAGKAALEKLEVAKARSAFDEVLQIEPANKDATEGIAMANAMDSIQGDVRRIRQLVEQQSFPAALEDINQLLADNPNNQLLVRLRREVEEKQKNYRFEVLRKEGKVAEGRGDLDGAIQKYESALSIKTDQDLRAKVDAIKMRQRRQKLDVLLSDGYTSLQSGNYAAARDIYKEAATIDPNSKEALAGREKASSLYLAGIRYAQNLEGAARLIGEGRFPLAAKRFNEALAARPNVVTPGQSLEESRIRNQLEAQTQEVPLTIRSDKKTYVSIVGILPPDRFKEETIKVFPDVYKVKGARSGYKTVEKEIKVSALEPSPIVTVICSEKQ